MLTLLATIQARIAGGMARERLREKFAPQRAVVAAEVAGPGLARVQGQLTPSTAEEELTGSIVPMTNVGRPSVALYAPQTGGMVVVMDGSSGASSGGGSGTISVTKPYATRVVAASNSLAVDKDEADFVCTGTDDQVMISMAMAQGGSVVLLDGQYNISGAIDANANSTLIGSGTGSTTLLATGAGPMFAVSSMVLSGILSNFHLANMRVNGAGIANCVSIDALRCVFENIVFTDALDVCVAMGQANSVRFERCDFQASPKGMTVGTAIGVEIVNCKFLSCTTHGAELQIPARSFVLGSTFRQCGKGLIVGSRA